MEQIVVNLLSNSIKFTEPGGNVTARCECDADNVRISVEDSGVGIAAEDLKRVFEPFVQLDAKSSRGKGGTGLGLAISQTLARGMGGDLTVESTPNVGSVFTLRLPAGKQ
ncbi:MAG: ATP-binding protein [Gemmatimonadaceae bacterium]